MAFFDRYLQPGKKPTLPKPFVPAAPTRLQSPAVPQMSTGSTQRNLSGLAGRVLPGLNVQPKTTGFNPIADTQTKLGVSSAVLPNQSSVSLESLQAANQARRAALAPQAPVVPPPTFTAPSVPTLDANALARQQLEREAASIASSGSAVPRIEPPTPPVPTPEVPVPPPATSADVQGKNQPAVSENRQRLEALREAYTKTLEAPPTSETEKALEVISGQMANLSASEQLGINKIRDQAIPLDFLTGQSAALQRNVAAQMGALGAQAVPLQTRLEQEQARRLALQKQKEVELGFAAEDISTEEARVLKAIERNKPYEVSPGATIYDPATGKALYTAPEKTASGGGLTEVSPGATLYDPVTGQPVYTAPEKTADNNKPLSAEAAKVNAIATTIKPEIEQLKDAFRRDYRGSVLGITSGTNRGLSKLVDQVADKVGRLRSGGAINKDEEARFKRQIASVMDLAFGSSEGAIAALDGILTEADAVSSAMKAQGLGSETSSDFSW